MKRWRQVGRLSVVLGLSWFTLSWLVGCSPQLAAPVSNGATNQGHLPFNRVSDISGISPTAAFASEAVPVGTGISIRLRFALSSADSRVGDSFQAILDEPLFAAGKILAPPGAPVAGRVVTTKASGGLHDPGYLRLTLASIALNGKIIPLRTSSIFTKGATTSVTSRDPNRDDVRFSTGHRFTFHLAQPLLLQD